MATPLDPKQIVSFEELLMSQVVQQEGPCKVAYWERDIHQGGVLINGKNGEPGNEEKERVKNIEIGL